MSTPTVIVTGASSGIGADTARRFADGGYRVYAVARRTERLARLAATSTADPRQPGITPVVADLTSDASLVALVQQVTDETGRIDVLVNNAGYGAYGAVEDVSLEEGRAQFEVNLFAPARLIQLVLPHMRSRGAGRIVNISSIGGKIYEPLGGWYHSTKYALEGLSDSLRLELRPHGIGVSVVEPGAIATEWGAGAATTLLRNSEHSAYAAQAAGVARVLHSTAANPRRATAPDAVASVIVAAATSRRPKPRYVIGAGARPLLFLRRRLTDRAFDRLMLRLFRPEPAASSPRPTAARAPTMIRAQRDPSAQPGLAQPGEGVAEGGQGLSSVRRARSEQRPGRRRRGRSGRACRIEWPGHASS